MSTTKELEARVTALEESMVEVEEDVNILQNGFTILSDEVDDVESVNIQQDERINEQDGRLNLIENDVSDNENDIEGWWKCFYVRKEDGFT